MIHARMHAHKLQVVVEELLCELIFSLTGLADQAPEELITALRAGRVVVAIGAGFSMPAGLPGYERFLRTAAQDTGYDDMKDVDASIVAAGEAGYSALDALQSRITVAAGKPAMCASMRRQFQLETVPPAMRRLVESLLKLPLRGIITWNWDELLDDPGCCDCMPCGSPGYAEFLARVGKPRVPGRQPPLVKMQGDLRRPETVVLSEDDYESVKETRDGFMHDLYSECSVLHIGLGLRKGWLNRGHGSARRHYGILNDAHQEDRSRLAVSRLQVLSYDSVRTKWQGNQMYLDHLLACLAHDDE